MTFEKGNVPIGVRFPEQSMKGNGRKLKIYTVLKKLGYGKEDISAAFGELAFYTTDDLVKVSQSEKLPHIMKIIAKQMIAAYTEEDWGKIRDIMEQVLGKAHQTKEVSVAATLSDKLQVIINYAEEEDHTEEEISDENDDT